jgi:hypothetical protein
MRTVVYSIVAAVILASVAAVRGQESRRDSPPLYLCSHKVMGGGAKPATYAGFYEAEFEKSAFKVSGVPCEVWLTGDVCSIFRDGKCEKGAEVKAYVTVEGVLSEPGHFGHFGMWERELRVTRVIKVHRIPD